jgi:hypothetical protein
MAAPNLSQHLIDAGAKLLAALDDAGLQAQGAGWIFDHGLGDWRFMIATSLVDSKGRLWVYKHLVKVMAKLNMPEDLTVADIHLMGTDNPLFRMMAQLIHLDNGVARFENCRLNDMLFDAAIYRWVRQPPNQADVNKLEKSFIKRVKELSG